MSKDTLLIAKDTLTLEEKKEEVLAAINPDNIKEGVAESVHQATDIIEKLLAMAIGAIPHIFKAIVILIVGLFLIRTVLKIVRKRFEKRNVDLSLRGFLISIIQFVLYALLILTIVRNLGFETTAILGVLSGLVLAVGLALQGSLSNFAGGVLILLFRPFEVGDFIENNSGTDGTVEKIDLLYTTLVNANGIKVFSPNGTLANSVIKNYTKISSRKFEYVIGIAYESNIKVAKDVIISVLNSDDRVSKVKKTEVFVNELADSSVNLIVRGWADRDVYWDVRNSLQEKIKVELDKVGISIPYPQREMRIISDK